MTKYNDLNLRQTLKDWTDIDLCAFHIGTALGIIPPPTGDQRPMDFAGKKWVFWPQNPIGTMLFNMLDQLVENNVLETHEQDNQLLRWNVNYSWSEL